MTAPVVISNWTGTPDAVRCNLCGEVLNPPVVVVEIGSSFGGVAIERLLAHQRECEGRQGAR